MKTATHAAGALGLWLSLLAATAGAQQTSIRFERVPGLSQSAVNCIYQDRQGFMWFGTEDGLNRFDGYSFSVFRRDPADPASLSHNFVWAVQEDAEGGLWVGTEGGLNRRAPGTTVFTRLRHDARDETTVGADFVWALLADRKGAIWVGTKGGGLSRYDPATRALHALSTRPRAGRLAAARRRARAAREPLRCDLGRHPRRRPGPARPAERSLHPLSPRERRRRQPSRTTRSARCTRIPRDASGSGR